MITQEDYNLITQFDHADSKTRAKMIKENPMDVAKTFLNVLDHVSKDLTVQYVLVMMDDMLQVCPTIFIFIVLLYYTMFYPHFLSLKFYIVILIYLR